MKYFLIAGEASGDMHAAALIRALRQMDTTTQFVGLGGDMMRTEGCLLFQDYRHMAYMGIIAVVKNLPAIRENLHIAKEALLREKPDVLILVDYPSFNLRIAEFCHQHLPCTHICYYIPPKVWAWKKWRVHQIAHLSELVLGIFPFEPAFYKRYGYTCTYVGNPTMDAIQLYQRQHQQPEREPLIAILPGSRRSEIVHCLPLMLEAAKQEADGRKIVIAGAPGIDHKFYIDLLGHDAEQMLVFNNTYDLLARAEAAIVNSGTATLEAALLGCPQVPVYHVTCSWIGHLRPLLFDSPFFTLPNIILQRELLKEKIAHRFTVEQVRDELNHILNEPGYRQQMLTGYNEIAQLLGNHSAAQTAAHIISRL